MTGIAEGFIKLVFTGQTVIDVGGGSPFQKGLHPSDHELYKKHFVTVDQSKLSHPTIWGDVHFLPFRNQIADGVVCKAVLEHVTNPFLSVGEIFRILKPGGRVYIWIPFLYPYHPGRDYGDYFRFTSEGARLLLRKFSSIEISSSLGYFSSLIGLLPQPISKVARPFGKVLDKIIKVSNQSAGWHVLAIK